MSASSVIISCPCFGFLSHQLVRRAGLCRCFEKNNGKCASRPKILGEKDLETVPNVMRAAATAHKEKKCMGVRRILAQLVETTEGKDGGKPRQLQFWRKGPYKWRTYAEVYADIRCSLLCLSVIRDRVY